MEKERRPGQPAPIHARSSAVLATGVFVILGPLIGLFLPSVFVVLGPLTGPLMPRLFEVLGPFMPRLFVVLGPLRSSILHAKPLRGSRPPRKALHAKALRGSRRPRKALHAKALRGSRPPRQPLHAKALHRGSGPPRQPLHAKALQSSRPPRKPLHAKCLRGSRPPPLWKPLHAKRLRGSRRPPHRNPLHAKHVVLSPLISGSPFMPSVFVVHGPFRPSSLILGPLIGPPIRHRRQAVLLRSMSLERWGYKYRNFIQCGLTPFCRRVCIIFLQRTRATLPKTYNITAHILRVHYCTHVNNHTQTSPASRRDGESALVKSDA